MRKYKLTAQDMTTHNGCKWEIGVKKTAPGTGELCSDGWLHYYHHPLLAVVLNPVHGNIENPRLWEIKAEGKHLDDNGLKGGCTEQTLIKELPLPKITLTQKIAFGVLCAREVSENQKFIKWSDKWLSGEDRSGKSAALAAEWAAEWAARAAEWEAAMAALAEWETARAAERAARAARAARAECAECAEWAEWAAERAARAAYAVVVDKKIDLIKIAKMAMKIK